MLGRLRGARARISYVGHVSETIGEYVWILLYLAIATQDGQHST